MTPKDAAALNGIFAPYRFYDRDTPIPTLLTKTGEFQAWLRLTGIDPECMTDEALESAHTQIAKEFHALPECIRLHQFLVKVDGAEIPEPQEYDNPIVGNTEKERREFLKSLKLSTIRPYMVFCQEPSRSWFGTSPGKGPVVKLSRKRLERERTALLLAVSNWQDGIGDMLGATVMNRQEIFWLLRFLQSLDPAVASSQTLLYEDGIDRWMGSQSVQLYSDHLAIGNPHLKVMSMLRPPKRSWPALLRDLLSIDCSLVVATDFQRKPIEDAIKVINASQRHFNESKWFKDISDALRAWTNGGRKEGIVADAAMSADVDELSDTLKQIKNGDEFMGHFSITVMLFDQDPKRVARAARHAQRIFDQQEGVLQEETYWAFGAYAGAIPGTTPRWGDKLRQRREWLKGSQYVDLSLFYVHSPGEQVNRHLQRESLMWLTTEDHTLYGFNLHEEDLLGAMILGRTGSGKSVLANAAIDLFFKYEPRLLVLDGLGGSYKQVTRKHGGNYFELTASDEKEWPFTFNPFQLSPSRRTAQHISVLLRMCMAHGGYRPTAQKNQILWRAIKTVLEQPFSRRRLGKIDLPTDMMAYLAPWIGDGQYGFVFDNEFDSFAMSHFQTIDLSEMSAYPEVLQPLIWHLFYLWSNVVDDPTLLTVPKLMVCEETWAVIRKGKLLRPVKQYIETAGRTWRKRNAGLMLVSQSLVEYEQADLLDILNELCPTKVLMYSPGADFENYARLLKLNEREKEQWISLRGKGDMFLKTNRRSKKLRVQLDPLMLAMSRNDPYFNAERDAVIAEHGFEEGLKRLAKGA